MQIIFLHIGLVVYVTLPIISFSKLVSNRMRHFLTDIISPYQGAFLSRRRTLNNIIIAEEVLKFLELPKDALLT